MNMKEKRKIDMQPCCAGSPADPVEKGGEKPYIIGWKETGAGKIPGIASDLSREDKWGAFKVRLSLNRMHYKVDPGLYAVGNPDQNSHVFVTANYKLSFDTLRRELNGLDAWIMALDTRGINVWCAAGKGTFGSMEVVNRIEQTGLRKIIKHRKLILPQLGAPGVAAHFVKKFSGFSVIYGPVRADDIKAFLDAGMVASPDMRRVRFSLYDRLLVVPVEIFTGFKYLFLAMVFFFLLAGLSAQGYSSSMSLHTGIRSTLNLMFAYLAGTVLGPLLLPWLPGRSFAVKGIFAGGILFVIAWLTNLAGARPMEIAAWLLLMTAISSFVTLNFTGASTYTSLSGVRKEMRIALPVQILAVFLGTGLWIGSRFV